MHRALPMKKPHFVNNPLREYRMKNYLLQVEAAKRCGVDHTMWSLMECLRRSPSLSAAHRISKRTGISMEELARFFARMKPAKKRKVNSGSGERGQPARPDQDLTAEHRTSGAS